MRRLLHILLLTFIVSSLYAQSEETNRILSYLQKAMNFNKVVPQEKVYLHFDNMGYFENETPWFKAYVTRTDNGSCRIENNKGKFCCLRDCLYLCTR